MSDLAANIERVVREVLAELGVAPSTPPAENGRSGSNENKTPVEPSLTLTLSQRERGPNNDDLVITSRVVTMSDILGRLEGVRRVSVERGAIVTPAVRDELLRRGISLGHADSSNGCAAKKTRLVIVTCGTEFDPAALAAAMEREKRVVERAESPCLIAATDQLAMEIKQADTLAVLLTPHTAAGLCLANRLSGVRAVTGTDVPSVAVSSAAVAANLLVVDPAAGTFFQLKQMVTELCREGVRPCPGVFSGRLG